MCETIDRFTMYTDRKTDKLMQNILQELLEHFEDCSYKDLHNKLAQEYAEIDEILDDYSAFDEINYMEIILSNRLEFMEDIEDVINDYDVSHGLLARVMSHFWYIKKHGYNEWLSFAYRADLVTEWDGTNLKDELTEEEKNTLGTWV